MAAERKAVVASIETHCPACHVPWGTYGCAHAFPTAEKIMASVNRIADEVDAQEARGE